MDINIEDFKNAFMGLKNAVNLLKDAKDLLPDGEKKNAIEQSITAAEMQLSNSQIAQKLGYHLCKCEFPPHIMLSKGFKDGIEISQCPKCGSVWPPESKPLAFSWGVNSDDF